jgi:hypothetical protein
VADYHDIFLSHSSKDTDSLHPLMLEWRGWGLDVFADFEDEFLRSKSADRTLDAEVADYLRRAIRQCHIFVFVASENSVSSHWMPWELGLAHGIVGRVHLYFPETANRAALKEHEYLQLYRAQEFDATTAPEYLRDAVQQARSEAITRAEEEQSRYFGRLIGDATKAQDYLAQMKQLRAFAAHGQATQEGWSERMSEPSPAGPLARPEPLPWIGWWPWFWPWIWPPR